MTSILSWKLFIALAIVFATLGGLESVYGADPVSVPTQTHLVFDGTNDMLDIPDSDALDLTSGELTIAGYINPSGWGHNAQGRIVDHGGGSSGSNSGWTLHLENKRSRGYPQTMRFLINNNSSYSALADSNIISLDSWQHVAVTLSSGTLTFYVDGQVAGVQTGVPTPAASSAPVRVGMRATDSKRAFEGAIDDLQIWDRALSQADIQQYLGVELLGSESGLLSYHNFNEGSGQVAADISGNANDGTLGTSSNSDSADPTWQTSAPPSQAPVLEAISGVSMDSGDSAFVNVIASDPTPDDVITLSSANMPTFGSLIDNGDGTGSISLNPTAGGGSYNITVRATDIAGEFDEETFNVQVTIPVPAISIQKTPNNQNIVSGSDATFTITVSNSGEVDLTSVQVTDALAPVCDSLIGALVIGEAVSYDCTMTDVTTGFTNVANVTAMTAESVEVTDSDSAIVNLTVATAPTISYLSFDGVNNYVDVPDSDALDLTSGSFTLAAYINPAGWGGGGKGHIIDHEGSDHNSAEDVGWSFHIDNSAFQGYPQTIRMQINLDSSFYGLAVDNAIKLDVWQYVVATLDAGTLTFYVDGEIVGVNTGVPSPLPSDTDVRIGQWQSVTDRTFNGGIDDVQVWDRPLTQLEIQQNQGIELTGSESGLLLYQSFNEGSGQTASDYSGNGNYGTLGSTTGADSADPTWVTTVVPLVASIDIQQTPDTQTILSGGSAGFTINVTNDGEADLIDVAVSDPLAPACDNVIGEMSAGSTVTYVCTLANVTTGFVNTASATGDDVDSNQISDSDSADIFVATASIDIQKTPDTQTVISGGDAVFTINVTNDGIFDLTNVVVSDPLAPACDNTFGALAIGVTVSYICTLANVTAGFTNTATVTGNDPNSNLISDSDTADVVVAVASIDIQKTPENQTVTSGSDATFTITISNDGIFDLTAVVISDPLAPLCDSTIGDLAAGSTISYTCTLANVLADFTNTATAIGTDPASNLVTDSDTADVVVSVPFASYDCDAVSTGLIGCWLFDEGNGSTTADSVGTNDGTLGDGTDIGPAWVTGASGASGDFGLDFDGANDIVKLIGSSNSDLNINGSQITIAAWVYIYGSSDGDGQSYGSRIVSKLNAYEIAYRNNNRSEYNTVRSHMTSPRLITGDNVFTPDAWNHVAITYNGMTETIYINGIVMATRTISTTLSTSGYNVAFGGPSTGAASNKMFRGILDNVRIYDRALDASEVETLIGLAAP